MGLVNFEYVFDINTVCGSTIFDGHFKICKVWFCLNILVYISVISSNLTKTSKNYFKQSLTNIL